MHMVKIWADRNKYLLSFPTRRSIPQMINEWVVSYLSTCPPCAICRLCQGMWPLLVGWGCQNIKYQQLWGLNNRSWISHFCRVEVLRADLLSSGLVFLAYRWPPHVVVPLWVSVSSSSFLTRIPVIGLGTVSVSLFNFNHSCLHIKSHSEYWELALQHRSFEETCLGSLKE
jgi:hypothetical protein